MTTSGLQIQQSGGSGRLDLAARRCAYSGETSLPVRSSRNGTTLKVGEKKGEIGVIPKAWGVPYLKEEEGDHLPWLGHVGLNPTWPPAGQGNRRLPRWPHSAHLGRLALLPFFSFFLFGIFP